MQTTLDISVEKMNDEEHENLHILHPPPAEDSRRAISVCEIWETFSSTPWRLSLP